MAGEDKSLDALLDELVRGKDATEIFGETGLLQELTKRVVERALEAEMSAHLGYPKHAPEGRNGQNSRNGRTRKRIQTGTRAVEVEVPRDRDGSFEPQLVHNRSDGTSVILAGHLVAARGSCSPWSGTRRRRSMRGSSTTSRNLRS
jgi:hypothetical protein